MFPGSAIGLPSPSPLASWILTMNQGALLSTHFGLDIDGFKVFGRALDDAFADTLKIDRRRPGSDPRWLHPILLDGAGRVALTALDWFNEIPMSPPPVPLSEGDRLQFQVPLDMKTADRKTPPSMGDWLRLGRNRIHRLVVQNGFRLWQQDDPRWLLLNREASSASWQWEEATYGTPWKPLAKYGIELTGWMGQVEIRQLPEAWIPWATLLPIIGVGSHIPYGCGIGCTSPSPTSGITAQGCSDHNSAPPKRIIPLNWRAGLAAKAGGT
jgi:hypothetical protein